MKFVTENSSKISKTFFRDIELYRPDIYEKMKMTRRLRIKSLVGILKEGQKSGTIRSDIDPQFAIDCLVAAAEEVLKPTNLSEKEYGGKSAYQMLFQIIIEGIKNK